MAKKGDWKLKLLMMFGLPLFMGLKSFVLPFFSRTSEMKEETIKLSEAIRQVKLDEQAFTGNWLEEMQKRELAVAKLLPDTVAAQEVIRYFSTQFAKQNPGVEFDSIVPGGTVTTNIQADKDNPAIRARSQKLQIKAKMPSSLLLNYLDHLSKYPALSRIQEFGVFPTNDEKTQNRIQLEVGLDLFLVPKEWLPKKSGKPPKNVSESTPRAVASTSSSSTNWFDTDPVAGKLPPTPTPRPRIVVPAPPSILGARFIGGNLVVEDEIYESGDSMEGWKILSIVPHERAVIFQRGNLTRKVVVR